MSLHLIFSEPGFQACRSRCLDGDVLVFLGDGVYARPGLDAIALAPDLEARGLPATGQVIDYPGLVALTEQHTPVVSWNA